MLAASHLSTPACVSQVAAVCRNVWCDLAIKAGEPNGALERGFDRLHRRTIPFHDVFAHHAFGLPTPQMNQ
jgi:hypothetical protein